MDSSLLRRTGVEALGPLGTLATSGTQERWVIDHKLALERENRDLVRAKQARLQLAERERFIQPRDVLPVDSRASPAYP